MNSPKILVLDSGLGGLTVYRELRAVLPKAQTLYIADIAAFPYGDLRAEELVTRLLALFDRLIEREKPDLCVLACNTASTIALTPLRDHFEIPFVGTVPAIKTAGAQSKTGLFSVLATPGTVSREYTRELIENHASQCDVTLVGAPGLATLAENFMRGGGVDYQALKLEIAPAFVENQGRRTDCIVLGCTHFPLLKEEMEAVAPWSVRFIDPAPAIARQTKLILSQLMQKPGNRVTDLRHRLIFTGETDLAHMNSGFLRQLGLENVVRDEIIG